MVKKICFGLALVTISFLFLSCTRDNDDDFSTGDCLFPQNLPSTHNFLVGLLRRDRCGLFAEDNVDRGLLVQQKGQHIGDFADRFSQFQSGKISSLRGAYSFRIRIPRSHNREERERIHQKMFRRSENPDIPDYLVANVWLTTVFPNESPEILPKIEIPFFIEREDPTGSSLGGTYLLNSTIINSNNFNKLLAGAPIFFVDYNTTEINPEEFENYGVTLLPAIFEGNCYFSTQWGTHEVPSVGILRAEINLFEFENGEIVERRTVLEEPLWIWER